MFGLSASGAIALVSAIIGLAILLGGSIAVLFAYLKKTTKDILRVENSDLRDRLTTVEKAEDECKERLVRAESTIKTLTDVVTGASAVAELKETVERHHQTILARLDRLVP